MIALAAAMLAGSALAQTRLDLGTASVGGIQLAMNRSEIIEVIAPQGYDPPTCRKVPDGSTTCSTLAGNATSGNALSFDLSPGSEFHQSVVTSVSLSVPVGMFSTLLQQVQSEEGQPSAEAHSGTKCLVWRSKRSRHLLDLRRIGSYAQLTLSWDWGQFATRKAGR
jgi:hypothetical protein